MGILNIRRGGQYGGQAVLKIVAGKTVAGSNPVPSARRRIIMFKYIVKIVFESDEPYDLEVLKDMVEENMLNRVDNAPFDVRLESITPDLTNLMGITLSK